MSRAKLILLVNEQHRKILQSCKQFEEELSTNASRAVLAEHFNDLIQYAYEHFKDEEELLERNYSYNIAEHREEHNEYIANLLSSVTPEKGEMSYRYHNVNRELLTKWWAAHAERESVEFSEIYS